jgi:hypothetical protein
MSLWELIYSQSGTNEEHVVDKVGELDPFVNVTDPREPPPDSESVEDAPKKRYIDDEHVTVRLI